MTLEGHFDTGDEFPLATVRGWGDFCRWADGLSAEDYPELIHLVEYGWSQHLAELAKQLAAALDAAAPTEDVGHTARGLLHALTGRGEAEALAVSNGAVEGDEDEGDGDE